MYENVHRLKLPTILLSPHYQVPSFSYTIKPPLARTNIDAWAVIRLYWLIDNAATLKTHLTFHIWAFFQKICWLKCAYTRSSSKPIFIGIWRLVTCFSLHDWGSQTLTVRQPLDQERNSHICKFIDTFLRFVLGFQIPTNVSLADE